MMEYQKMVVHEAEADQRLAQFAADVRNGVESALEDLVRAISGAFAVDALASLTAVLVQAQATFQWQRQDARARTEQKANFVFRLARAVMRTFGLSAKIVSQDILAAATFVASVLAVAIPIVVAVFTFGAAGAATTNVIQALATAGESTIRAALTTAFGAGAAVSVIVAAGPDLLERRGAAWAAVVADAWRSAPSRPQILDLARAFRDVLGLTAEEIAAALRQKGGASLDGIVDIVVALFGNSAPMVSRALLATMATWPEIATELRTKLGSDAGTVARALKDLGTDSGGVASALRTAGYAAGEVAQALKDVFAMGAAGVAQALKNAGFGDIVGAVAGAFGIARAAAEAIVHALS